MWAAERYGRGGVAGPRRGEREPERCCDPGSTFVSKNKSLDVNTVKVPVIGGHAGTTIVPLLSQVEPSVKFDDAERDALTHRIMFGGDEVVKAKAGGG